GPTRAQGTAPGRTPEQPAQRRPRLTGRSAIVIVVLAVLFVSYATSLRAYLSQRSHINELQTQIAQDRRAIAELQQERRRWKDEAFIEAQARERFGWVLPGEVGLRVIGEDGKPLDVASELTDPASLGQDPDAEWWSTAWTSVRGAGAEQKKQVVAPAQRLGPQPERRRGGRGGPGRQGGAGVGH
ncbi:MAG: FtsB family cell division protein, partial [Nocardioidaceae bacterium]